MEKEELKLNLQKTIRDIKTVDRGLNSLSDEEYELIKDVYLTSPGLKIENIAKKYNYSQRQLFRKLESLLIKITLAIYGQLHS